MAPPRPRPGPAPPRRPPSPPGPRLVLYHQTTHRGDAPCASLLPLLDPPARLTHLIVAALHIHASDPARPRLNDHLPSDARFSLLWQEAALLQRRGVRVLAMLGGAAPGCFARETLDAPSRDVFLRYYEPLRDLLHTHALDGIDLDVEQPMSLPGIVRLVDALRTDMGPDFLITLAPVAAAMVGMGNLSGFDYFDLDAARGCEIAWYNVQFYNNWGDVAAMLPPMQALWDTDRIVVGQLTSPENGNGFAGLAELRVRLAALRALGVRPGGVMGWEYFNALPGGPDAPWLWAREVSGMLGLEPWPDEEVAAEGDAECIDDGGEAPVPKEFVYVSDRREHERE